MRLCVWLTVFSASRIFDSRIGSQLINFCVFSYPFSHWCHCLCRFAPTTFPPISPSDSRTCFRVYHPNPTPVHHLHMYESTLRRALLSSLHSSRLLCYFLLMMIVTTTMTSCLLSIAFISLTASNSFCLLATFSLCTNLTLLCLCWFGYTRCLLFPF